MSTLLNTGIRDSLKKPSLKMTKLVHVPITNGGKIALLKNATNSYICAISGGMLAYALFNIQTENVERSGGVASISGVATNNCQVYGCMYDGSNKAHWVASFGSENQTYIISATLADDGSISFSRYTTMYTGAADFTNCLVNSGYGDFLGIGSFDFSTSSSATYRYLVVLPQYYYQRYWASPFSTIGSSYRSVIATKLSDSRIIASSGTYCYIGKRNADNSYSWTTTSAPPVTDTLGYSSLSLLPDGKVLFVGRSSTDINLVLQAAIGTISANTTTWKLATIDKSLFPTESRYIQGDTIVYNGKIFTYRAVDDLIVMSYL